MDIIDLVTSNQKNILLFLLTVSAFLLASYVYRKGNQHVLLQPLLISVILVVGALLVFEIPYAQYIAPNKLLQWLLGPAVVSLAIPMYQNLTHIRQWLPMVLVTIVVSAALGVVVTGGISLAMGFEFSTQVAMVTKSATTPIALSINEVLKGHLALAALVVMFTGLLGAVIGPMLLNQFGFDDHRIQGVALGLTSHAIGTQKAMEISPVCGAFSALAMTLTGVFLSIFLPLVDYFLTR